MKTGRQRSQRTKVAVTNRSDPNRFFECAAAMEEPLSKAISYGSALELIGFGLKQIDENHGQAILAIAEAVTAELAAVQTLWRQMIVARSDARRVSKPQPSA